MPKRNILDKQKKKIIKNDLMSFIFMVWLKLFFLWLVNNNKPCLA